MAANPVRGTLDRAMTDLVRACQVIAYTKLNPNQRFPRDHWADDETFRVERVLKAATSPAMTSTAGWVKELAPVSIALLANLIPTSAGAELLARAIGLDFNGAAVVNMPALAIALADFVAQGASIPVVNGAVTMQAQLTPSKFAVIVTLTREMVESSNAEVLIRTALIESTGPALDRRLFDANPAVPDLRPAGILNGITPIGAATGGSIDDAMATDLSKLAAAVAAKAGNGGITFIASPVQAVAITMRLLRDPYPVLVSTALPAGTVIAIANNALVVATDDPQIDTTNAATMQMDDTAPVPPGSIGPLHTVYQTDMLGLRLRWPCSWEVRDKAAIAFVQGAAWPS